MKKYAVMSTAFMLGASALFIGGIFAFSNAGTAAVGNVCVCCGFVCLGLGIFFSRKERACKECEEK